MEWLTYALAGLAIVIGLVVAFALSGLWIGWWRQRRWPRDDE
jgi:hypothetical protein